MSEFLPSLFVVSGPSGAGKSTVLSRVLQDVERLRFSVSHTTREPRVGERDGISYHFVERAEFEALRGRGLFLEWAEVHGELYGTARSEYERARVESVDLLLDVDVQGAAQVRRQFDDAVSVFILPPSYAALERRLRGRGPDDEAQFNRRLAAAAEELSLYREYDYAIVNEALEHTVQALEAIIRAARCRTTRVDGRARKILDTFPKES
ncbi:MAG TPA: guanylate kinase [Vicinamibacteria bacterium]|nr:guanylate kinase [Vicinamibacteria bacterium]